MIDLILASQSVARARLLALAGVPCQTLSSGLDELAAKTGLLASQVRPRDVADALAEMKAMKISRRRSGFVIGADQTLELEGALYDKVPTRAAAKDRLLQLRGRTHHLHSAVVVARDGDVLWRDLLTASLTMRHFSDEWLESYLDAEGDALLSSVGCYRLEGLGIHLFDRIEGDYFTILGLPLLGLLRFLRVQGYLQE